MSPWLFNVYMDEVMKEMGMERRGVSGDFLASCTQMTWFSKRKDMKTRKSRSKEKVVGFSSASLFPAMKLEIITQGGTRGIDHPTRRRTQGAAIVIG